jgi:hypothetical protein
MSNIIRWWDWVSPNGEQEMIPFLRTYMGKGMQFRTPKRRWEDLWRLKRGDMNHIMGMRKGPTIKSFSGPKYQKGIICAAGVFSSGGTVPNIQNITDSRTQGLSTAQQRTVFAWDSDGSVEHDIGATTALSILYTDLTTQTDDANTHTNDWWPDQPETNEGLNWDIQFNDDTHVHGGGGTGVDLLLRTAVPADRVTATWYLLDTVSNDHGDALANGCLGLTRQNGAKTAQAGTSTLVADIEIRATGSGSAVTSNTVDITIINSDMRLKDNIEFIGYSSNGVRLYTWTWNKIAQALGINAPAIGVIAQEHPYATVVGDHGYLQVNYGLIF